MSAQEPPVTTQPAAPTTAPVATTAPGDPGSAPTTAGPASTAPTSAPTTAAPQQPTGSTPPTTAPPSTTVPATGDDSGDPGNGGPASGGPDDGTPGTTLPTEVPEGFSEQQFRTFVDVVTACGPEPGAICSRVFAWTDNRTLAEAAQWLGEVPVRLLVIALVALAANALVRRAIARYVARLDRRSLAERSEDATSTQRRTLRMTTASGTLASAASVGIFTAALFAGLAQLDISLGPLLAGAGIAGVALGFGAQNMVRDVLAGIFVLVEDQYGIGDVIDVGRASGTVEGISLRVTRLRDVEGTLWFVPNGIVNEVGNKTQRWARVILDVEVAYGADHHEASRLMKEVADETWRDPDSGLNILEEPELWGVEVLGDSSVSIRLAVQCVPADQWAVARELRSRIKDVFDREGIEIPFPQQTVWMRSGDEPPPERRTLLSTGAHAGSDEAAAGDDQPSRGGT